MSPGCSSSSTPGWLAGVGVGGGGGGVGVGVTGDRHSFVPSINDNGQKDSPLAATAQDAATWAA